MIDIRASFDGRRSVVVGGSSGIGRQVARELSALGSSVVVIGRRRGRLERVAQALPNTESVPADISTMDDCLRLADVVGRNGKAVDHLVVSAGYFQSAPLEDVTKEHWDKTLNTNLCGLFWTIQALLPLLKKGNGKSIVLISSILAHCGSCGTVAYTASKGGVSALTRALALELAAQRIRVNAVSPAHINTPLISDMVKGKDSRRNLDRCYPLGRIGELSDVAPMIVFLLSDLSSWITGCDLVIDGGRSLAV